VAVDGGERQPPPLQHATSRRFSEKSPAEKEELYERIASQLMSIGDTYVISSPSNDDDSAGEHNMFVAEYNVIILKITVIARNDSHEHAT